MSEIALIIPCYNEQNRLSPDIFLQFLLAHPELHFFFVNDGSSDNTLELLNVIKNKLPGRVTIIHLNQNLGKGNAIRSGILAASNNTTYSYFGYLDADLSTSLEELLRLFEILKNKNANLVAGSRIKMHNARIERSAFRHAVGRVIATIIDSKYRLEIYDTQCGAKCFNRNVLDIFKDRFHTRWFFDIEMFLRLRQNFSNALLIEEPLNYWSDPAGSRLSVFSFPLVAKEIISLFTHYRK